MFLPTLSLRNVIFSFVGFQRKHAIRKYQGKFFIVTFNYCFVKVGSSTPSSCYASYAGNETQTPGKYFWILLFS